MRALRILRLLLMLGLIPLAIIKRDNIFFLTPVCLLWAFYALSIVLHRQQKLLAQTVPQASPTIEETVEHKPGKERKPPFSHPPVF